MTVDHLIPKIRGGADEADNLIKIAARYCAQHDLMETELASIAHIEMPFDVTLLPTKFPALEELKLWIYPAEQASANQNTDVSHS